MIWVDIVFGFCGSSRSCCRLSLSGRCGVELRCGYDDGGVAADIPAEICAVVNVSVMIHASAYNVAVALIDVAAKLGMAVVFLFLMEGRFCSNCGICLVGIGAG